jgi:hypothetical protein
MYTRKSKGPKTVPCGTPDATGFVEGRQKANLPTVGLRYIINIDMM